ncbi:MAG TPA: MFS transporter [Candidatus Angelobacter sp.]|nr:MFS transporter [Candidatus Angelobacter sp.]
MTRSTENSARLHYAWIVAGVTFLVLLATAGIRATPSVLMVPLEHEFGWTRAAISGAIAINIALFGIIGPFAASFIDKYGLRRLVLIALGLLTGGVALSSTMHAQWQLTLFWGVLVGSGSGVTAMVLAAIVVNRWFDQRRGLVLGLLTAANATGQLVFLPLLASLITKHGWRSATYTVAAVAAVVFFVVLFLLRDKPADLGLLPYGASEAEPPSTQNVARTPVRALLWSARRREFWILAGTFFICGASTNGLIGTHLIPACMDHGIPEVTAAGMLAAMGIFDLLGTTASGWLTDRFNSRYLLFWYYALRGLSLIFLPFALASQHVWLSGFAVFYGLDWVATVPPTVRLTANTFGRENVGVVYGWIGAAHQLGASAAALTAGTMRTYLGDYRDAFWLSGGLCLVAAMLLISTKKSVEKKEPALATVSA